MGATESREIGSVGAATSDGLAPTVILDTTVK